MNFEKTYSQSPDSLKLKFLDAILAHNNKLQQEFTAFVAQEEKGETPVLFDKYPKIIHDILTRYRKEFEAVDIENPDWENYHPPHSGYIEEWEAYQMASEQEFEAIFKRFFSDAVNKIIGQQADEMTAMLMGLYNAAQNAEIHDTLESFADVNEHLLLEHTNTMNMLIEKLRLGVVSGNVIRTTFDMFFRYCDARQKGKPHFASHFEQLLIALAEKSGNTGPLLALIDQSMVKREALPELVLLLNKKAGNDAGWLKSAEKYYLNNAAVGQQLLEYYFETDKNAFLKTARELFPTNKDLWANFLQKYVTPQLDQKLYVDVFWQLTTHTEKISYYHKIRDYLSETEFGQLLKELRWNTVFVVKILEVEKRYDEIKTLVEKNNNDWHYAEMIAPIVHIFPEFCFQHIKNKAIGTLQNQRGRSIYQRIAQWLKLAQTIPGFENKTNELIRQLYNHKPNLPALKDEMRLAGLVG